MHKFLKLYPAVTVWLLLCPFHSGAQLTISASIDKKTVQLDDSLTLSVTIAGTSSDVPDPQLPSLPNFNVYSSGRSQNISFVNGKISSSVTYNFMLTPRFVGKALIGPVSVTYNGQKYETGSAEITVVRPSSTAGPQQVAPRNQQHTGAAQQQTERRSDSADAFVSAEVDRRSAFVNEQINLSVRF